MSEKWWNQYQVSVPAGKRGDWEVDTFTVDEDDLTTAIYNMRCVRDGHYDRQVRTGTYTRITCLNNVVMSDTPAEINDHLPIMKRLELPNVRRVLIHGLGLGMVLQHALRQPHITHVDVVELEADVIALVEPHYQRMVRNRRPSPLHVHQGDALRFQFPKRTRWDLVWHDIWDDINPENLSDMALLNRRYGHRCEWQGCWSQDLVVRQVARAVSGVW